MRVTLSGVIFEVSNFMYDWFVVPSGVDPVVDDVVGMSDPLAPRMNWYSTDSRKAPPFRYDNL
jgi:hypothetical protein